MNGAKLLAVLEKALLLFATGLVYVIAQPIRVVRSFECNRLNVQGSISNPSMFNRIAPSMATGCSQGVLWIYFLVLF